MSAPSIDELPGFRRRFIVTPGSGWVRSELEDDLHCMSVTLRHEGGIVTSVEPAQDRRPWTTCSGAMAVLEQTFTNVALDAFATRGNKSANCTHLHDLAVLAAAHAKDSERLVYDILVSDPIDGKRRAELRRNGIAVLSWTDANNRIVAPAELAGMALTDMRAWIDSQGPVRQEEARLLRWGAMVAHGRTMPLEEQSDARRMPPNCYTFQPEQAVKAVRFGKIIDFSRGGPQPLEKSGAAISRPNDQVPRSSIA